jgi:hypothetical protein
MVYGVLKERGTLTFIHYGLFGADEGNVFILNMKDYLANDTASYPSGTESSTVPL